MRTLEKRAAPERSEEETGTAHREGQYISTSGLDIDALASGLPTPIGAKPLFALGNNNFAALPQFIGRVINAPAKGAAGQTEWPSFGKKGVTS